MDLALLVERLGSGDERQRVAAAELLVGAGAAAVGPLLRAAYEDSALGSSYLETLWRLGDAALWPVVQAIADGEDHAQVVHAGSALAGLQVSNRRVFVEPLRHPSAAVRDRTLIVFEEMGPAGVEFASDVLPLVGDAAGQVRGRAIYALKAMRPEVVPVLRELRRSRHPARRHAVTALAELGGWAALDPTDQALIQRLIAVKMRVEVPEPMHLCGGWFALRTDDQQAVLAEFGLSDPFPVTMRLGAAAWHNDSHWCDGPEGTRAYVSPVLDGWTLVFGEASPDCPLAEHEQWIGQVEMLSHRFGEAHHYYIFEGCTEWIMAEHGQLVRAYSNEQPDDQFGPPHPAERGYLLPHETLSRHPAVEAAERLGGVGARLREALFVDQDHVDMVLLVPGVSREQLLAGTRVWFAQLQQAAGVTVSGLPDAALADVEVFDRTVSDPLNALLAEVSRESPPEPTTPDHCDAAAVAGHASVNPEALGRNTIVRGHGVLALTAIGRIAGTPPGALPI